MRVISGSARGLKLLSPEGLHTRPTTDRIKETLFNIMQPDIYLSDFLDLFSGSGAIGIEALSRGAEICVFVDNAASSAKIITKNIEAAHLSDKARVIKSDVFDALSDLGKTGGSFDIIFMDPPYAEGFNEPVLKKIVESGVLKPDGYIVLERSSDVKLSYIDGLEIFREKIFKNTTLTFLKCGGIRKND